MIPKKIHYCWYGNNSYNDVLEKCANSWKEKLPDYEFKKWDETNTPFDKLPFLKPLLQQKKFSFISDYIRLFSVYTEGGIYLDTDIEVLKNFDELITNNVFVGFQIEHVLGHTPLNSAVIGATKSSPFILECIKETEKKQRMTFHAIGGPHIVSKVLLNYGLKEYKLQKINDVNIYTTEYFYPLPPKVSFNQAEKYVTQNSYCIHWWQESWTIEKRNLNNYIKSFLGKLRKLPFLVTAKLKYKVRKKEFYYINKIKVNI